MTGDTGLLGVAAQGGPSYGFRARVWVWVCCLLLCDLRASVSPSMEWGWGPCPAIFQDFYKFWNISEMPE